MDAPRLKILMLGPPMVTWDGVPLKIARQQMRLLLFYLAAQWKPVHRSTICQVFWPEKEDISARKLLREALSKLRAALPDPLVLISESGDITLDLKKVYVDGLEFKKLTDPILESADFKRDVVLPGWLYSDMRKALDLCRGDMKVESISNSLPSGLEDFFNLASQAYDYIRLRITERLASHCIALGDLEEAIMWLSRAREIDPLNDDNNFLLVSCLIDYGRSKDALEYIDFLENLYAHLSEQKLPDIITAQRDRILNGNPSVENEISEWPGIETHPVPFVGRMDLIERLRNALNRKGMISIRGSSGVGKNRLLEEFYLNLQRKPRLVFCSGKPLIRCSPFEPIIEGLIAVVRQEEWLELGDSHKNALRTFFPAQLEKFIVLADEVNIENNKDDFLLICEALHQLFIILAKKKPLLLVIDIILWCDDATLDFLAYLSDRDYFKNYGLLIFCSRNEESNIKFENFMDYQLVKGRLEKIEVPVLSQDDTALLLHKMVGFDVGNEFLEKFYQDTGGNPYFIVEGLKSLLSVKFDFQNFTSNSLYPIPDTIKSLISEKTRILSANAVRVLQASSILGQFFMPEVVEGMLEIPAGELILAFEELEKFSIISVRQNPEMGSGYFFDHNQIREVVLSEMSPLRKRKLHQQAVSALMKIHGNNPAMGSVYAYHYEEAVDIVNAFKSWVLAAEFARTRFSMSDRFTAYEHAARLVQSLPPDQLVDNVYQLVKIWGNLAYDISDVGTCEKIYNFCLKIGEQTQSSLLLGLAWSGIGQTLGMQLKIEEGIEAVKKAEFFVDRTDYLCEKLENKSRLGVLYTKAGDYSEAIKIYESAMALMQESKDEYEIDSMVNVLSQLALLYIFTGQLEKSIEVSDRAVNLSLLVKRRSARIQAVTALACGYYFVGSYAKTLQNAQAIYQLAIRLGMTWWVSFLDVILGRTYLAIGEMDAAWNHFQLAYDREIKTPENMIFPMACSIGGQIYRLYGDLKAAKKLFLKGMESTFLDYGTLENHILHSVLLVSEGNLNEAQTRLEKVIEVSRSKNLVLTCLPARLIQAEILMFQDQNMGDSRLKEIVEELTTRKFKYSTSYGMALLAAAEAAKGNREAAIAIYRSMLSKTMDLRIVWTQIATYSSLYKLLDSTAEKQKIKKEITKNLALIGEKSTLPVLRRLYLTYRKKIINAL